MATLLPRLQFDDRSRHIDFLIWNNHNQTGLSDAKSFKNV